MLKSSKSFTFFVKLKINKKELAISDLVLYLIAMIEKYITIQAAADLLEVTQKTVYNYINEGLLTKYQIKKKPILYKEEVENLLVPRVAE